MELSEIELRTREEFGDAEPDAYSLVTIEKGGSGRIFVRISGVPQVKSVVLMHFTEDRPDNVRFAPITDFLIEHHVPVPAILRRRNDLNLLWMEDLGEVDLHMVADTDWEKVRRPAYDSALRNVFLMHQMREEDPPKNLPPMEPPFDEGLYRWERGYFLKRYVAPFVSEEVAEAIGGDEGLERLGSELAAKPRSLIHRDFQSTNVMIVGADTRMIDYQGMRWGLPEYDLASMVYDPYTEFTAGEREHLIDFYFSLKRAAGHPETEDGFRQVLTKCAMQRLMQALGAYGYISEVRGKPEFLQHIPVAKARLLALAKTCEEGKCLVEALG